jgi:hypothetical protein
MAEKIFTEEEYRKTLIRFLEICDAEPGTPEYNEARKLASLMEDYENMSYFERIKYN